MLFGIILVIGLDDGGVGYRGMHIERHIERLGPLEDRPEPLVIEKDPVGQAIDYGAPLKPSLVTVRSSLWKPARCRSCIGARSDCG
jgi:hypothetical protein